MVNGKVSIKVNMFIVRRSYFNHILVQRSQFKHISFTSGGNGHIEPAYYGARECRVERDGAC